MDGAGWISVALLAGFNRVRALAPDGALVRELLRSSRAAELDAQGERVRMARGAWAAFVLPAPGAPVDGAVEAAVLADPAKLGGAQG
jgi:hypothetical protein